jgi:Type III flagellar switch regulator (C-ring) FliN C-term
MTTLGTLIGGLRRFRPQAMMPEKGAPEIDEAGLSLRSLARGVVLRAHEIVDACAAASHGPVEFGNYGAVNDSARTWRFKYDRREIICALSDTSERQLLGWILGAGVPIVALSHIERSIAEESLRRMLSVAAQGSPPHIEEEPRIVSGEPVWHCDVHLSSVESERVTIQLYTRCAPSGETKTLPYRPDLRHVAVHLRAALPSVGCTLSEVLDWRTGSLLRLQGSDDNISVGLYAGGHRVALAQLGIVFGNRAVKVVALGNHVHR